jgi:cyanobactin cluster PatC/TenC/TruC protein
MEPRNYGGTPPITTWTLVEPHQGEEEHLHATGLEDYGYWLRWKQSIPAKGIGDGKPYRRGVIFR